MISTCNSGFGELKFLYILLFLMESKNIKSYYVSKYISTLNEIYPYIEPRLFPWFYIFLIPDRILALFPVIPKFFIPHYYTCFCTCPRQNRLSMEVR